MGNVYVHNSNNWILNQIRYNLNAQMMNNYVLTLWP